VEHWGEAESPGLQIQLLGGFRLELTGRGPVGIIQPRLQHLIAYLLLHRHAYVSRQQIAFALWPDTTEAQAFANLRNLLHRLRATLPHSERYIGHDRQKLWWQDGNRLLFDVATFEESLLAVTRGKIEPRQGLEAALAHYHGDLLPDCYDDWIAPFREHLRQAAITALTRLVALLEQLGEHSAAIRYSERLLRDDPLNEATYRNLMRLHALAGDRAGVERIFNACVSTLKRELTARPEGETEAAHRHARAVATRVAAKRETLLPPARSDAFGLPAPPPELSALIGRENEVRHVREMLGAHRVVTLTGATGIGKSRLAQHVALELAAAGGNVGWVDLELIADGELLAARLAAALGVSLLDRRPPAEALAAWLRERDLLLALDNCERIAVEVGLLLRGLLREAPRLRVLATSCISLGILGEWTCRVPPLTFDRATLLRSGIPTSETLLAVSESESVQLFIARAQAVLPTFALTAHNAFDVARVCRRLDGIPLAIELAATRITALSVREIAERLDNAIIFLGAQGSSRHQTLVDALAWSHGLLSEPEQALFRRLAVFAGSFTLDSAEIVCGGSGLKHENVLEVLAALIDKSLVEPELMRGQRRFRMREVIRQYALARLAEAGELDETRARLLAVCARLVAEAQLRQEQAQQAAWLDQIEAEHDNLRAALAYGQTNPAYAALALGIVGKLERFWATRGHFSEGRHWARALLGAAPPDDTPDRQAALEAAANLAYYQADYEQARVFYEQALRVSQTLGDRKAGAAMLRGLGALAHNEMDTERALTCYRASLELCREIGDLDGEATSRANLGLAAWQNGDATTGRQQLEASLAARKQLSDEVGIAYVLHLLADIAWSEGRAAEAQSLNIASIDMRRRLGDRWGLAYSLDSMGVMAAHRREGEDARRHFTESLSIFSELGSQRGLTHVLDHIAGLLSDEGHQETAAQLMAAADSLRASIRAMLPPNERQERDTRLSQLHDQLGDERFAAARTLGVAMLPAQAIDLALRMIHHG
jgi:non-specific serine/threonine protein kinase